MSPFGFNRERYAILTGRAAYRRNQDRVHATSPRLRRNIHRLEKAMIMEPRRPRFALAYIAETVEAYELYQRDPTLTDAKLARWSTDVLHAYFAAVQTDDALAELQARFEAAAGQNPDPEVQPHSPFLRGDSPELTVSHEDLLQLAIRRRFIDARYRLMPYLYALGTRMHALAIRSCGRSSRPRAARPWTPWPPSWAATPWPC